MTATALSRRRALTILAATGGAFCLGGRAPGDLVSEWRGTALGAEGRIRLAGMAAPRARQAIAVALDEVERLEAQFSLYRPDSELSRLNATGRLDDASHDMRVLTGLAVAYWRQSEGAFNPAIQPLWAYLAGHFATRPDAAPDEGRLAALLELADPRRIVVEGSRIALAPGMALTFNGIAQGYITDRVAGLLRQAGFADVLVDLGEFAALPGRAWAVELEGSEETVSLSNRALATSAPAGLRFSADGRWHHLIDPQNGHSAAGVASVTVVAANATEADAVATALAVGGPAAFQRLAGSFAGVAASAHLTDGSRLTAQGV